MRQAAIWSSFLVVVVPPMTAGTAVARWRYYDDRGRAHEVETENQVPGKYRQQAVDLDPDPPPQAAGTVGEPRKPSGNLPVVASKSGVRFEPVLPVQLPRLPTASEIFAVRMAVRTPDVSGPILDIRQEVGADTWTLAAVLSGVFFGAAAFFIVDRFSRTSPVFKVAVAGVATALIIADLVISAYASRLESAVALFEMSRRPGRDTIGISGAAPPPRPGNAGVVSGSGRVPDPARRQKFGDRPVRRSGQWDFQEVLRTLQEQLEGSTTIPSGPDEIPDR